MTEWADPDFTELAISIRPSMCQNARAYNVQTALEYIWNRIYFLSLVLEPPDSGQPRGL
jgi:hypothetical protein